MAATPAADKPKRFPQLTLETLNGEQRPLGEYILTVSSVGISGPYNPLLRSPDMAKRMLHLLDYLRWNSSLDKRLTELAILIQGRRLTSQVEWFAHEPIARKAGLSDAVMAELKLGKRPSSMKEDEAVVYDFSMELTERQHVSVSIEDSVEATTAQGLDRDYLAGIDAFAENEPTLDEVRSALAKISGNLSDDIRSEREARGSKGQWMDGALQKLSQPAALDLKVC